MEEAAAAEAAEAERKKREAEEKAKVEAARKAAEQAKLNALGLEGKIEEYGRLLAGELSNADRFEFQNIYDKLVAEKKVIDDEKRRLEEARLKAEQLAKQKAAEEAAAKKKAEEAAAAAKAKREAEAEAKRVAEEAAKEKARKEAEEAEKQRLAQEYQANLKKLEEFKGYLAQSDTAEDKAMWKEEIGALMGVLYEGDELRKEIEAQQAAEAEAEKQRLADERRAQAAAEAEAKRKAAEEAKRNANLEQTVKDLIAQIEPLEKVVQEAEQAFYARESDFLLPDGSYDWAEYDAAYALVEESIQNELTALYGDGETDGLYEQRDNYQSKLDVFNRRKAAEEAKKAEAEAIAAQAKADFEAQQKKEAAEALLKKQQEEAAALAAKLKAEKEALEAELERQALEKARLEELMNSVDKNDPAYIEARKNLIATRVDERLKALEKDAAEVIARETEAFMTARDEKVESIRTRGLELEDQIVKLDVQIDEGHQQVGVFWDELTLRQQRLTEVQSLEEFETVLTKLKEKQAELNGYETALWKMYEERDNLQSQRDRLEQQSFMEELKGESDYRARFVQELTAAIKEENKKRDEATGDDADIEVAMAEAAANYFQGKLEEQTEIAAVALEDYTENKTRFDTEVARYKERKAI